ncbi:MAG: RNA-binding S4 domain-containing protein [Bacteroidales bacterium]|nr:RNA-binding S4 domain-containing protein [Bacteroidales bacterium]
MDSVRLDKWLWAVRLFKTRSAATEACKGGKVKMNGINAKPSREIKVDDEIEVIQSGIRKKVRVKQVGQNRVGAKLVPELMEDLTPVDELEKLDMLRQVNYERRDRGVGRPTKKDRRMIDLLKDLDDTED